MSKYKEIKGFKVQTLASDTAAPARNLGQVYFNSGSNAFKVTQQLAPTGTWSSGGALNTARYSAGGSGTQTAGLMAGGTPPGTLDNSEEYNGTSWAEGNNLVTGTQWFSMTGTQTATIGAGGFTPSITTNAQAYDGTSWTEVNNLNLARYGMGCFGIYTSAIVAGGANPGTSPERRAETESWNGTTLDRSCRFK